MNPFVLVSASAGIFAATGRGANIITIAGRICAAVAGKIEGEGDKILDPAWWTTTVGMIPGQTPAGVSARTISGQEAAQLANLCTRADDPATLARLQTAIAGLITALPPLSSLNCLTISQSKTNLLRISLAIVAVDRKGASVTTKVDRSETTVNYGDAKMASEIDEIFGSTEPLTNQPYYVCVDASS